MRPQQRPIRSRRVNLVAALLAASILIVAMDAVAGGRQSNAAVQVLSNKTSGRAFLTPLSTTITLAPNDQRVLLLCAGASRNGLCPDFSRHGGARGGAPLQALNFATNAPNLRVTFILDEVSNTLVAGGGADEPNRATWLTHSPIASLERYPYGPLNV